MFHPRPIPTLITAFLFTVLMGLGFWQIERLHWKEALLADIDQRAHAVPVDIASVTPDTADYRAAKASGTFLYDKSFYLFASNRATGEGGYHVLTPLQLPDGGLLLVDRGWIPYAKKPDGFAQPSGVVSLQGLLLRPAPQGWMQPANNPAKGEWYNVDLAAMSESAHRSPFLPYVLSADATPNEGGLPVGGQMRLDLPNDHFSYAVTWFALAGALLVIYVLASCRANSPAAKSKA